MRIPKRIVKEAKWLVGAVSWRMVIVVALVTTAIQQVLHHQ